MITSHLVSCGNKAVVGTSGFSFPALTAMSVPPFSWNRLPDLPASRLVAALRGNKREPPRRRFGLDLELGLERQPAARIAQPLIVDR